MTNDKCKLCNLESIGEEHFKDEDITVVSHILDGNRVFIAVPLDYVNPRARCGELWEKIEAQLFKVVYEFYWDLEFHIHKSCPYNDPIKVAGVKKPPCRLCLSAHKPSSPHCGGCGGHGDVRLKNEETLQKLKKIGIIE